MKLVNLLSTILLGLTLMSCSQMATVDNPFSEIPSLTLKSLTYQKHELPSVYQQLIHTVGNIADIKKAFIDAKGDEYTRYSLAVVVYEKTLLKLPEEDVKAAQDFFELALNDDFDWVKTKAIWGLARVGSVDNFPSLIKIMQDPESFLADDVHASLALIRQRTGLGSGRTPAAQDDNIDFHNTGYWTKWWKKNSK